VRAQVGDDGQVVDDVAQRRGFDKKDAHESRNYPGLWNGWDNPDPAFFRPAGYAKMRAFAKSSP
jgi:hypothetical protein